MIFFWLLIGGEGRGAKGMLVSCEQARLHTPLCQIRSLGREIQDSEPHFDAREK